MPRTDADLLIRTPEEITGNWLGRALELDDVEVLRAERIGTGQMSQNIRVAFTAASGPGSVVIKLASDDEGSRSTGVGMGAYFREIAFYQHLAGRLGGSLARCHLAVYDEAEGWFTLILEDVVGATQGDQIAGCTVEEARLALRELARLHAPIFNDLAMSTVDFLNLPNPINQALMAALLPGFLTQYQDRITPEQASICQAYVDVADAYAADRRPPLGLVHGDYRLDNLLFAEDRCTVVDWQTLSWGPAMQDAAYFLGGSLEPAVRREHEQDLVRAYYDELLAQGVANFSWETCWEEYRRQTMWSLMMVIVPAMVVVRTERGDDMFMAVLGRVCEQIKDLDALSLLPAPGSTPPALQPSPEDEGSHEPTAEQFWNESWYLDAAQNDASLGVYARIGKVPNLQRSLISIVVVADGRPAVLLVDQEGPLPSELGDTQLVEAGGYRIEFTCEKPLEQYRVRVLGNAEAFADHAAPLRAERGVPVELELDLLWTTNAVPYAWRASTRYEIPCRVTGTIRIDGERHAFDGPGQRDHSWGARDWWANDWMWSAFHLADGRRTHAVTIPEMPGFGVGYVQQDGEVVELTGATTTQEFTADGLVAHGRIEATPGPEVLEVTPVAWGALRLVAPDGRVTHFPRAMARVRTADGVDGVGWIEWNVNQK